MKEELIKLKLCILAIIVFLNLTSYSETEQDKKAQTNNINSQKYDSQNYLISFIDD